MSDENSYEDRLLTAFESIAESLKILAEKPPVAATLEITEDLLTEIIPANSDVVILDEDEKSFRVSIAKAHISFDISKTKAEVVEA